MLLDDAVPCGRELATARFGQTEHTGFGDAHGHPGRDALARGNLKLAGACAQRSKGSEHDGAGDLPGAAHHEHLTAVVLAVAAMTRGQGPLAKQRRGDERGLGELFFGGRELPWPSSWSDGGIGLLGHWLARLAQSA